MYAVIRTGGKQYRVNEGDTVEVEHLSVKGKKVTFTPVLVVTDDGKTIYGRKELRPYSVVAKIVGDSKGSKVDVFKYRPKSGYSVKHGHRQLYSLIEITSIGTKDSKGSGKSDEPEAASEEPAKEEEPSEPAPESAENEEDAG
jgi:large subunit ribosomal protein L21